MAQTSCRDGAFGPWAGSSCRGGFDLTLYFEEAILAIPLDAIFLVAAAYIAQRHLRNEVKLQPGTWSRLHCFSKLAIASCLIILRLALLVLWADASSGFASTTTRASVPAAALSFVASLVYAVLSWREHERTVRPSFEIEMYLFFATLLSLARARTLWMIQEEAEESIAIPAIFTASLGVQAVGIVVESWEKHRMLREPYANWARETLGGTFNKSFFVWLCPILLTGSRQILSLSDLPPLDPKLEAEKLETDFQEAWESVPDKSKSGALMVTWFAVHGKWILAGVIPRVFQIGFMFSQPLLVEAAVAFAATPDETRYNNLGYGLIGAYAIIYTGIAVSTGQQQWRMVRVATYMRGALVPVITRKTLRIDLSQAASASALTLVTTDMETIDGGVKSMHELWAALIEIALGAYLLYRQIGQAMGIPVGVAFFALLVAIFMAVPIGLKLAEWIKASEIRVATTSHTLAKVKSYRMAGLSGIAFEAIEQLRVRELQVSRTFRLWFGAATILPMCLASLNPVLSFAGFVGLSSSSSGLTISQALTSLSILALLNRPLSSLSVALTSLAGAVASFDRIQDYLIADEKVDKRVTSRPVTGSTPTPNNEKSSTVQEEDAHNETANSEKTVVDEKDASLPPGIMATVDGTLTWPGTEKPTLAIHDLTIPSAAVTLLLGPTGCGKTTLLNTILGEMPLFEGTIRMASLNTSYCAQKSWLPSGTIREAIVGTLEVDEDWYARTVAASALLPDLAALPEGDGSLLGNKGTSLSGGQKQRLAIARAVYARRQICIFDDAFKGLDNTTSDLVMENLFGPQGLLRTSGTTSIVSSSDDRCGRYADYVVTMDAEGTIASQESAHEAAVLLGTEAPRKQRDQNNNNNTSETLATTLSSASPTGNKVEPRDARGMGLPSGGHEKNEPSKEDSAVKETDLSRQEGDAAVHKFYAKAAGLRSVVFFLFALAVSAATDAFSQIWIVWWTEAIAEDPDASNGKWLGVYAALGIIGILANFLAGWEIFITVITKTGLYFHSLLVKTVSQAPMSFFHTVDQGVTVNRFSQDIQLIDMELPGSALGAAMAFATVIGQAVIIGVTGRYIAIAFPFIIAVFYIIQKFYLRTSRQMRFLDIEHTAPLYSHTIEILDGLASIRAFSYEEGCLKAMCHSLNESQRPAYILACLQQWLLFASDMTVAVMAVLLIIITTTLRQEIGVGFMGLALSNIVAFGTTVQMLLVTWVQLEISIGAIARIKKFSSSIDSETLDEPTTPGDDWPLQGQISFSNVSASYPGTGRVLKDINLEIPAGSKIGICGRTGSGKSSLSLTLFKLIQVDQGSVLIDGIDLATVAPDRVRDAIVGLPQDFLTLDGSTVRYNIDPLGIKTDEQIKQILEMTQLWTHLEPRGGLDLTVTEDVLSHGELQLLAFARVMARESKILVLDEISSSMDETTGAVVDELIRTKFQGWTIISVAHKLESIRHFDKILVLDAGRIAEFGEPDALLADPSSLFKKLYEGKIE